MIDQRLYELRASICKVLSHPKRLEILDCLWANQMNVKELVEVLGVTQSTVSRCWRPCAPQG